MRSLQSTWFFPIDSSAHDFGCRLSVVMYFSRASLPAPFSWPSISLVLCPLWCALFSPRGSSPLFQVPMILVVDCRRSRIFHMLCSQLLSPGRRFRSCFVLCAAPLLVPHHLYLGYYDLISKCHDCMRNGHQAQCSPSAMVTKRSGHRVLVLKR